MGVHHKLDYDENSEMLENKYLILVHGVNPQGKMIIETQTHTNHWLTPDEYSVLDKRFGDIDETLGFISGSHAFLTETEYRYKNDAY